MANLERPIWLPDSRSTKYTRAAKRRLEVLGGFTNPSRGYLIGDILKEHIEETGKNEINFLEVGIGRGVDSSLSI